MNPPPRPTPKFSGFFLTRLDTRYSVLAMDTHNWLWFSSQFALLLLVTCVIAGGVLGALIRAWSILSRLYSLEDRTNIVEATIQREVKIRAANSRPIRTDKDILKVDETAIAQSAQSAAPWWSNPWKLPRSYSGQ